MGGTGTGANKNANKCEQVKGPKAQTANKPRTSENKQARSTGPRPPACFSSWPCVNPVKSCHSPPTDKTGGLIDAIKP